MGGDHGPRVIIPACLSVLRTHPDLHLIFVGKEDQLESMLKAKGKGLESRYRIQHASEVVAMDEPPAQALRTKKDSSMRVAINLVKNGEAQACVSAGNTGALMATARFVLKMLPGVDRPAIITRFPTQGTKEVRVLDLGANVNSNSEHLFQFAVMGSIFSQASDGGDKPKVGLLNIGEEDIKGTPEIKGAAELLSQCKEINYIGYVEGDDIFRGRVDVVVCDGFVGNAVLKACEGLLRMIKYRATEAFMKNWLTKLSALPGYPVLKKLMQRVDPRRRNGATLLGLDGIVVKSHGGADQFAFACAVEEAVLQVEHDVIAKVGGQLQSVLDNTKLSSS